MDPKYEYGVSEVQAVYTDQEITEFRFNPLIDYSAAIRPALMAGQSR